MNWQLPKSLQIYSHIFTCNRCGKKYLLYNVNDSPVTRMMKDKKMCWDCAYWDEFVCNKPNNYEVIGDCGYIIMPFINNDGPKTICKKTTTIYVLKRNGECVRSNNYIKLHQIPYHIQEHLPVSAWFVTFRFWNSLNRSTWCCQAMGCLDRYKCYRYNYKLEFDKQPHNRPPLDWKPGCEYCPAFLPIKDIEGYDEYIDKNDIIDESIVE